MITVKMNGLDVLKKIREVSSKAKVIMITGFNGGPQGEAEKLGISQYLNKPVTVDILENAINNAMDKG